jgi:hypothetical protein
MSVSTIEKYFATVSNEKERSNVYPFLTEKVLPAIKAGDYTLARKLVRDAIESETALGKSAETIGILAKALELINK